MKSFSVLSLFSFLVISFIGYSFQTELDEETLERIRAFSGNGIYGDYIGDPFQDRKADQKAAEQNDDGTD